MNPTAEQVAAILSYDSETGQLTYARSSSNGRMKAGEVAGGVNRQGYRILNMLGRRFKAHRVAWLLHFGVWPTGEVDHINGARSDNRIANLRDCSKSSNQQNVWRPRADSTLGFRGVHKLGGRSKRYLARTYVDGKRIAIGHFDTAEEAGAAYLEFKRQRLAQQGVYDAH